MTATMAAIAAPTAGAAVSNLSVTNFGDNNTPQTYVVGVRYALVVTADRALSTPMVNFYDDGQCVTAAAHPAGPDTAGTVGAWGPAKLTARQGRSSISITVNVVPAPAGSTPETSTPLNPCVETGSLDSGSSGSGS